jgi:predicted dehydrogenase
LAWVNDTALGGAYIVNCDIHALDVALWIARDVPVSAVGYAARRRPNPQGDSPDSYALSFRFKDGLVMTNHSEHLRNGSGFRSGCHAYGQQAVLETAYGGQVSIRGTQDGYAGGETKDLYAEGMRRNVDTFHRCITQGIQDNPTLEPSVNSTLVALLGREAARLGHELTWEALLRDTTRCEVDLTGLDA